MRVGDNVYMKYPFRIIRYESDLLSMTIEVEINPQKVERLEVPTSIWGIGLRPPEFDFCTPGDHLPIGHPDYYQMLGNPLRTNIVLGRDGYQRKLQLSTNFNSTGEYSLIDLVTGEEVKKIAKKRNRKEREDILSLCLGEKLEGNYIQGKVVKIIMRSTINNQIKFVNSISEIIYKTMNYWTVYAVIRDSGSGVEFEIPAKTLETKS